MNVIKHNEVEKHADRLGAKTRQLQVCIEDGFNVPPFVALPSDVSEKLFSDADFRREVATEVFSSLKAQRYAVRSSALIEDGASSSFAGQFTTKLNVSVEGLSDAIEDVLKQAREFLGGLDAFSIIVQEYIDPDIAGVIFTRNPQGGREMVLEYGSGDGEAIVGGSTRPTQLAFYWNEHAALPRQIPPAYIEKFKQLEMRRGAPQDVEWCARGDDFFVLQTRPITTISKEQYEQMRFLDSELPKEEDFFYEKSEVTEIAPRPTPFTLSLMKLIYADDGPIQAVYRKNGVRYVDTGFLSVFGNELYIDKEKELRGLLPAYSYLGSGLFTPRLQSFSGSLSTAMNIYRLNTIRTDGHAMLLLRLRDRISAGVKSAFRDALDAFLFDYRLTFECNLLFGLAMKKAQIALNKHPVALVDVMRCNSLFADLGALDVAPPENVSGNALEIADVSEFIAEKSLPKHPDHAVEAWWKGLPELQKKFLKRTIEEAIIYSRLREYGRWLTVKNITALRSALAGLISENPYFATIEEVLQNQVRNAVLGERREIYSKYSFNLPSRLTSRFVSENSATLGISAGVAEGELRDRIFVESADDKREVILYTDVLSPDLAQYFDRIKGIVSKNGGLLSHLAILAREKGIPVIIGPEVSNGTISLGDMVRINGSKGEIARI